MTEKFDRFEVGRTLEPNQRSMFFRLGSTIQSMKTHEMGFLVDSDYCHETALCMLEATNWKSLNAAKAMYAITR